MLGLSTVRCSSPIAVLSLDGIEAEAARSFAAPGPLAAPDPEVRGAVGRPGETVAPDHDRPFARDLLVEDAEDRAGLEHSTARRQGPDDGVAFDARRRAPLQAPRRAGQREEGHPV